MIRFTIPRNITISLRCTRSIWSFTQAPTRSHIWSTTLKGATASRGKASTVTSRQVHDGKHFFTTPQQQQTKSEGAEEKEHHSVKEEDLKSIGQAIAQKRHKRRKQIWSAMFGGIFGVIIGYSVIYKVIYLKDQSFIPLFPSSKIRKLSARDLKKIDANQVQSLSKLRVLEKLSGHDMIKEQYGVPLLDKDGNSPRLNEFSMWCEDQDPCVTGIVMEPDDKRASSHTWYRIPFVCKWRITHRPISIRGTIDDLLNRIGLETTDLFEIISPERVYGSFKYEYPLQGDSHALHVWFHGELELDDDSLIVYNGKYHVDVKLQEIDLFRREKNGQLVQYVLFKNDTSDR
ncbi:Altered inheritance of mitochondria protein 39, mitochondrial [Saccharomyces pastorianus]|uniref:Altered inheritance of mitochondria protein 39, mitochondrial n=1 Tax=Saccharomyces pastorianus TaxID=27292 RepID=A0A6C1EEX1_SACPS|nr:Altered inheritance of mitochondria protein 39, mitochondrial [Saccharomyces pastorianus]